MLQEMASQLPPSEAKIAKYILEHPEESISLTANELGKNSSTSGAAVIRLCKSLGLSGLQELKMRITGDLLKRNSEEFRDIEPNETKHSIIEKMTTNSIRTIRETAELIRLEELSKATDALINARTIHFFGVGGSSIVASDAQQKFLRISKNASAFSDIHMAATLVANAQKDDVVVGISFSGETVEVAKIIELANQRGVTTISITKYGNSLVSNLAQIALFTSATREATFRSGATSSRIAQLHVIDILFMCVASSLYEESIEHLDQTREAINYLRDGMTGSKRK
ncbi:MurR/RpiR family transcriptional regulator [Bacillus kwashiorkori]|uniref:MurR/RpiR family transcriptional regulator n=1 Tax=Bacillus kwashiorkori TaxID=1522318 RepID=UPI0009816D58|nr:MurR/RpiR family transcriptional regulator [Bacillus kwashiorkori]